MSRQTNREGKGAQNRTGQGVRVRREDAKRSRKQEPATTIMNTTFQPQVELDGGLLSNQAQRDPNRRLCL